MINQLIASRLAVALSELNGPIISRLAGLVKVLQTDAFTKGKVSKFPIPVEASPSACARSGSVFPDLVPDQRERLIVYFEDMGATNRGGKWVSRIRLVGWGNARLFAGAPAEVVPAMLIARITRLLERNLAPDYSSPVQSLRCEVTGSPAADADLFAKYTYTETRSQYLLPPYFAFGLDLQLTYVLNDACLNDLTGLPVTEC